MTIDATTLSYNAGNPEGKKTFTNAIADAEGGITVDFTYNSPAGYLNAVSLTPHVMSLFLSSLSTDYLYIF